MIQLAVAETENNLKPKISVLGVGGAGCNAVNNMIESNLEGVEFLVANTDAQSLVNSQSKIKIQLGVNLNKGLGAGADPDAGRESAQESLPELIEALGDANMVFITAGMGGGTGTGAAPVIAEALKEQGILTVGVVTKPFAFEGTQRIRTAMQGIEELKTCVDTLIIIPNQNLFNIADKDTTLSEAFSLADEVLHSGISAITDLIVKHGKMNRDFSDIKAIMIDMGEAMMGTGEAEGENRAIEAAEKAISNPLIDNISMQGARGVLINIISSENIKLFEVDEIINKITDELGDGAEHVKMIIGQTFEENMGEKIRVSIMATGMDGYQPGDVQTTRPNPRNAHQVNRPFMDDNAPEITPKELEEEVQEERVEPIISQEPDGVFPDFKENLKLNQDDTPDFLGETEQEEEISPDSKNSEQSSDVIHPNIVEEEIKKTEQPVADNNIDRTYPRHGYSFTPREPEKVTKPGKPGLIRKFMGSKDIIKEENLADFKIDRKENIYSSINDLHEEDDSDLNIPDFLK